MKEKTFTELFHELFPFACEAGINAREYWLYTIEEINMTIMGYRKRLATQATLDYKQADLMASSLSRLMDKNAKFPSISQAYPGLIEPERPQEEDKEKQLAKTKAWLVQYAMANNARRTG